MSSPTQIKITEDIQGLGIFGECAENAGRFGDIRAICTEVQIPYKQGTHGTHLDGSRS